MGELKRDRAGVDYCVPMREATRARKTVCAVEVRY